MFLSVYNCFPAKLLFHSALGFSPHRWTSQNVARAFHLAWRVASWELSISLETALIPSSERVASWCRNVELLMLQGFNQRSIKVILNHMKQYQIFINIIISISISLHDHMNHMNHMNLAWISVLNSTLLQWDHLLILTNERIKKGPESAQHADWNRLEITVAWTVMHNFITEVKSASLLTAVRASLSLGADVSEVSICKVFTSSFMDPQSQRHSKKCS